MTENRGLSCLQDLNNCIRLRENIGLFQEILDEIFTGSISCMIFRDR
jgi:hypothetical protein